MEVEVDEVGLEEETCSLPWPAWPTGALCRTCLAVAGAGAGAGTGAGALSWHDTVSQHGYTARIRDMLVFLGFIENEEKEEYPDSICQDCIIKVMISYQFKLTCADANATLASLPPPQEFPINFDNLTDLEIIQLDHGYDLPFPNLNPEAIDELNISEAEEPPQESPQNAQIKKKKRKHEKGQRFYCNICQSSYTRLRALNEHLAAHIGRLDHLCPHCGITFHSSRALRQHVQRHSAQANFPCPECGNRYHSARNMQKHFRIAHTKNKYIYSCTTCKRRFTDKSALSSHEKIHSGRRDHKCNECPKAFTRATYLRAHQFSHVRGETPKQYACPKGGCEGKFHTKNALKVHMQAHKSIHKHNKNYSVLSQMLKSEI